MALFLAVWTAFCPTLVEPSPSSKQREVDHLIAQLDSPSFQERESATRELTDLGTVAITALEHAVATHESPEARVRALIILDRFKRSGLGRPMPPRFDHKRVQPIVKKAGKIREDERWTADHSYHIIGNLRLIVGVTLTIEPGTVVLMEKDAKIEVRPDSTLVVEGDEKTPPAVFTALGELDGEPEPWGAVESVGSVRIHRAQFRYGSGVVLSEQDAIKTGKQTNELTEVEVYHTRGNALAVNRGRCAITGLTVREASGTGLIFRKAYGKAHGVTISGTEQGMVVHELNPECEDIRVQYVRGAGFVSSGTPKVQGLSVSDCNVGAVLTGGADYLRFSLSRCYSHGIVISGPGATVRDSDVRDMEGPGIVVERGCRATLINVSIENCKGERILARPGSSVLEQ